MATISNQSKMMIQMMLTDSKISEKVFENTKDKEKYKICTIEDSGAVILGKTSWRLWNRLLNCQDTLPFESFALKVWDALVDCSSGTNNKAILEGLSREVVMNSVRNKKYDWVVNRLYDCWRHVAQLSSGYQQPVAPEGAVANGRDGAQVLVTQGGPSQIVLNIDGVKKIIPIIDSVGDSLNVGLEFGITGVRRIR